MHPRGLHAGVNLPQTRVVGQRLTQPYHILDKLRAQQQLWVDLQQRDPWHQLSNRALHSLMLALGLGSKLKQRAEQVEINARAARSSRVALGLP